MLVAAKIEIFDIAGILDDLKLHNYIILRL